MEQTIKRQCLDKLEGPCSDEISDETDELDVSDIMADSTTDHCEDAKDEFCLPNGEERRARQVESYQVFTTEKKHEGMELDGDIAKAKAGAATATSDVVSRDSTMRKGETAINDLARKVFVPDELNTADLSGRPSTKALLDKLVQINGGNPLQSQAPMNYKDEQARLLGDFNNLAHEWNFAGQNPNGCEIDMSLQPSLIGEIRPLAHAVNEATGESETGHHLIIGVTGAGKTSAMTDVARSHYVIRFQCESARLREPYEFTDRGYEEMIGLFTAKAEAAKTVVTRSRGEIQRKRRERLLGETMKAAREVASIELVCRMYQLLCLFELNPKMSPFEYFMYQRTAGDGWMANIRKGLQDCSEGDCRSLIEEMRSSLSDYIKDGDHPNAKLVIMLDDLDVGMWIDPDSLYVTQQASGFAAVQAQVYDQLMDVGRYHVIYIGTSFDNRDPLQSVISKGRTLNIIKSSSDALVFPTADVTACKCLCSRLDMKGLFDLNDIKAVSSTPEEFESLVPRLDEAAKTGDGDEAFALEVINRCVVNSRFQILTMIPPLLVLINKEEPDWPKLRRFIWAVCSAVVEAMDDLMDGFTEYVYAKNPDASQRFSDSLMTIWSSLLLMTDGKVRVSLWTTPAYLTKLGIGNYITDPETTDYGCIDCFDIQEPIVFLAIRAYVLQHRDEIVEKQGLYLQEKLARFVGRGFDASSPVDESSGVGEGEESEGGEVEESELVQETFPTKKEADEQGST